MSDFARFFRRQVVEEIDPDTDMFNKANEFLDFAATVYYERFLAYLDKESSRPLKVGDHMDMIQSAVRANTLREIRDTMVRRVANARSAAMQTED